MFPETLNIRRFVGALCTPEDFFTNGCSKSRMSSSASTGAFIEYMSF
ncbi:unnamed protein product [Callosobruchus maculatus]|uniref:Uncharacterized protein n=1 Tax=Callosobruchus maculatus TaxID=64391 RepID=A0A653CA77_CALMS|nr:unnamed protein product [Callosobruchus maculatus]